MKSILKVRRKKRLSSFSPGDKIINAVLLLSLFLSGLYISIQGGLTCIILFLLLWLISYPVIFAGTCRYCVNYGKPCPIPLEGSVVHYFFDKKDGFGTTQLVMAWVSYLLRIILPAYLVFYLGLFVPGLIFFSIFLVFSILHQQVVGCPNCLNARCPLNPDYRKR